MKNLYLSKVTFAVILITMAWLVVPTTVLSKITPVPPPPPGMGTLQIWKYAFEASENQVFKYNISPGSSIDIEINGGVGNNYQYLPPITIYTVKEVIPASWEVDNLYCNLEDGTTINGDPATGTISNVIIQDGKVTSCSFSNSKIITTTATLTVTKRSTGGDGTFNFKGDLGNFSLTTVNGNASRTFSNLTPATYSIIEDYPPGSGWIVTNNCKNIILGSGDNKSCIIVNEKAVIPTTTLQVNKITIPSNDIGKFDLLIDGTVRALNVGNSGSTGRVNVSPGPHTVTETDGIGTNLNNYNTTFGGDCDSTGRVTVAAGENKSCTITNTKKAKLILEKKINPANDTGKFRFKVDTTAYPEPPDFVGHNGSVTVDLAPGSYTVNEEAVPPTLITDYTRTFTGDCSSNGSISLAPGQTKVCTIINTKTGIPKGKLLIFKNTVGGKAKFDFVLTAPAGNSAPFSIDTALGSDYYFFDNLSAGGAYSIRETLPLPAGWIFTQSGCSSGSPPGQSNPVIANIVLGGPTTICSFEDTKRAAFIAVKNANGDVSNDQLFNLITTGGGGLPSTIPLNVTGSSQGGTATSQAYQLTSTGPFSFNEPNPPLGWTLTSRSCSYIPALGGPPITVNPDNFQIPAGATATCTANNDQSSVTITKTSVGGIGTFSFTIKKQDGTVVDSISITTDAPNVPKSKTKSLPFGSYTVAEEPPASEWITERNTCIFAIDQQNLTKTCPFTNIKKAKLTVVKKLSPANDPGRFNLIINSNVYAPNVGNNGTTGAVDIAPGNYTVSETAGTGTNLANYVRTISGDCAASGTITLAAGENKTCMITNERTIIPATTLQVNKITIPSNDTGKFDLLIDGVTRVTDVGNNGTTGALSVTAGTHTVLETAGTGTSLSNYNTVIGGNCAADGTVTLTEGQNKTCTITNTRKGSPQSTLTVTKILEPPNDTGKFNLTIDGTGYAANVGNNGTTGAVNVSAGTHTVDETAGTGTNINDYNKTFGGDCSPSGSVIISSDNSKSCTIKNTKKGSLVIKKTTVGGDGTFKFIISGPDFGPAPLTIITRDGNGSESLPNPKPGDWTIAEIIPTGWKLIESSCTSGTLLGQPPKNPVLAKIGAGQTTNCTFKDAKNPPGQATLTVVKQAIGGTGTFNFTGSGSLVNFSLTVTAQGGTASQNFPVQPGTYSVSETPPSGWNLTSNSCQSIQVNDGETKSCTIVNTKLTAPIPPIQGRRFKFIPYNAGPPK